MDRFAFPTAFKAAVGLGTFVIAGLMAREASREGLELFEDKVNDQIDRKIKKQTPPPTPAE
jgi:hypothetical protein